jgi:uncharacterized protein YdcH (DUF465 family)
MTGVPWVREREFRTPITTRNHRGRRVLARAGSPASDATEATGQKEIREMKESVLSEYLVNLESRHRDLDDTVSRLERRAYLTPTEQRTVAELKKEKLLTKDRIVKLRSSYPPPPDR